MILLDFSAVMHQCIFSAISTIKPKEVDGQYKTEDYIQYAKYRILEEILNVQKLLNLVNERLNLILKQIDENTELSLSSSEKEIDQRLKKLESDFENLKGKNNGNS